MSLHFDLGWAGLLRRNRPFAAFFLAQTISPIGDRLNQVALAVLVFGASRSASLAALVFAAGFLPQALLGPLAGVYVDRFDRRRVMIASDLVRAALVLTLPVGVAIAPVLALPLVFAVATVTLFFRPASGAIVPRLVAPDDLLAANSVTNTGAGLADLGGYPLAALITTLLAPAIWIAFVLDAASYLASALLCLALPADRPQRAGPSSLRSDLGVGWRALRADPVLAEGTVLSAAVWLPSGIAMPLLVAYASGSLHDGLIPYPASYSALLLSLAVGLSIGAAVVSPLVRRFGRGAVIMLGYASYAPEAIALALSGSTLVALGAVFVGGLGNLLWLVPLQTIYMERTPRAVFGRVIAIRQAVVWAAMTASALAASVLASAVPVSLAIGASGVLAGLVVLAALARPAMRNPDGVLLEAAVP